MLRKCPWDMQNGNVHMGRHRGLSCDKTVWCSVIYFSFVFPPLNRFSNLQQVAPALSCFTTHNFILLLIFLSAALMQNSPASNTSSARKGTLQHPSQTRQQSCWGFRCKYLSLCYKIYLRREVWIWGIDITGTVLYQRTKAFLTASYRRFIVKAAAIQNATASCFLCGSNQKKTADQGQQRQAFLLQQTDESPYTRPYKTKTLCHKSDSQADYIPPFCGKKKSAILKNSWKLLFIPVLQNVCWSFEDLCLCERLVGRVIAQVQLPR